MFDVRCSTFAAPLLLCFALTPSHPQPPGPPRPPGGIYNPYQPLIRQGPLPAAVQQALQGILLFPAQAAALPGAVHLKPGTAPSPVLPLTPVVVDPLTGTPAHPLTPAAVDQRSVLYLMRLQAGDRAPEVRQWLKSLPKDQVISLLEKTPWRKDDHAVCDALVQTLLETHGVTPEKAAELPPLCALRVAQSLGSRGDKRCEPVFERLLEQHRANEALAVPAVLAFAEYYRFIGDYAKSAETFLRAKDHTQASNTLANCTVEAARAYMQAGNEAEAERLYGEVAKYGYGWATGVALYDRAKRLVDLGRHDEARRLLQQPVSGQYAEQVQVVLLSTLGLSHYMTGDFASARKYCQEALTQYERLRDRLEGEGVDEKALQARTLLTLMGQWSRQPFVCEPREIRVVAAKTGERATAITRRFTISSSRPLRFTASTDAADVQAWLEDTGWGRPTSDSERTQSEIAGYIRISLGTRPAARTATLILSSPDIAGVELRVPIRLDTPVDGNAGTAAPELAGQEEVTTMKAVPSEAVESGGALK